MDRDNPIRGRFQSLRRTVILAVGVPAVIVTTGAFYSLSGIHGGSYANAYALAGAHGVLLWWVYRLGGGRRIALLPMWLLFAVTSIAPMILGHAMGYGDMQTLAYRMVQSDETGRYPAEWKPLDRETVFPLWVGRVTGREGSGVGDYLRAQATIGWEGREKIAKGGMQQIQRAGLWGWFAWACHLALFFVAGAVAYFAALRKEQNLPVDKPVEQTPPLCIPAEAKPDTGGTAPADPPESGEWSHYEERSRTSVSFSYEPRGKHASLRDFFETQVRHSLRRQDSTFESTDVRNYLERVCVMREISYAELARFIRDHCQPVPGREVPRLPEQLVAAIQFRDDPNTKGVIWETERGYWRMGWSKE